jgi:D-serine deaminase-like pyridoxal phosphate-dependent protein
VEAARIGTPTPGTEPAEPFMEPFGDRPVPLTPFQRALLGRSKGEIDTPALLLDLDRYERNATHLAGFLREHGVNWRPHSKAHKSPQVARRQVQLGAIGITCAKVGEAEVMVDFGIRSILIANEQGVLSKFERIAALNRRAEVITCADDSAHVQMAAQAALAADTVIPMLVELNVGQERAGTFAGQPALELARLIARTPGVRLAGVMGWEGHLPTAWPADERERLCREAMTPLIETAHLIEADGIPVPIVSGGGSGTHGTTGLLPGMTEIQAGAACLMDRLYGEQCHLAGEFEYALTIMSTVVSRPIPGRAIIDAGFKTMSGGELGFPMPLDLSGATLTELSAEHGHVALEPEARHLRIGDRVEWIPGYSDTTTFLHNQFVGLRGDRVTAVMPLLGRGLLT